MEKMTIYKYGKLLEGCTPQHIKELCVNKNGIEFCISPEDSLVVYADPDNQTIAELIKKLGVKFDDIKNKVSDLSRRTVIKYRNDEWFFVGNIKKFILSNQKYEIKAIPNGKRYDIKFGELIKGSLYLYELADGVLRKNTNEVLYVISKLNINYKKSGNVIIADISKYSKDIFGISGLSFETYLYPEDIEVIPASEVKYNFDTMMYRDSYLYIKYEDDINGVKRKYVLKVKADIEMKNVSKPWSEKQYKDGLKYITTKIHGKEYTVIFDKLNINPVGVYNSENEIPKQKLGTHFTNEGVVVTYTSKIKSGKVVLFRAVFNPKVVFEGSIEDISPYLKIKGEFLVGNTLYDVEEKYVVVTKQNCNDTKVELATLDMAKAIRICYNGRVVYVVPIKETSYDITKDLGKYLMKKYKPETIIIKDNLPYYIDEVVLVEDFNNVKLDDGTCGTIKTDIDKMIKGYNCRIIDVYPGKIICLVGLKYKIQFNERFGDLVTNKFPTKSKDCYLVGVTKEGYIYFLEMKKSMVCKTEIVPEVIKVEFNSPEEEINLDEGYVKIVDNSFHNAAYYLKISKLLSVKVKDYKYLPSCPQLFEILDIVGTLEFSALASKANGKDEVIIPTKYTIDEISTAAPGDKSKMFIPVFCGNRVLYYIIITPIETKTVKVNVMDYVVKRAIEILRTFPVIYEDEYTLTIATPKPITIFKTKAEVINYGSEYKISIHKYLKKLFVTFPAFSTYYTVIFDAYYEFAKLDQKVPVYDVNIYRITIEPALATDVLITNVPYIANGIQCIELTADSNTTVSFPGKDIYVYIKSHGSKLYEGPYSITDAELIKPYCRIYVDKTIKKIVYEK